MLQRMVSVFLIGGLALIYSAESVLLPRRLGSRREEAGNLYTGILYFLLTNLHSGRNIRDIHSRKENGILPWKDSCFVSPYIYIAYTPHFYNLPLKFYESLRKECALAIYIN